MVRSGSTWSFHVALKLLRLSSPGQRVFGLYHESPVVLASAARPRSSQLVIKSHKLDPTSYDLCRSGAVKTIYTWRQPYDAVVSCLQIFGFSVEYWIKELRDSLRVWSFHQATDNACIVSYESIMTRPIEEIARVGAYLGLTVSAEQLRQVAEEVSFERVRKLGRQVGKLPESRLIKSGGLVYDRDTLLHANHIRNGAMGFGSKVLTEDELSAIDAMLREEGFAFLAEPHGTEWLSSPAENAHQAQLRCLQSIAADRFAAMQQKDAELARLNEQLLRRAEVIEQQESRLRQIELAAAERLSAMDEKEAELGRLNEQLLRRAEVIEQQESHLRQIESVAAERLSAMDEKEAELGRLNEQLLRRAEVIEQQESRLRQIELAAAERLSAINEKEAELGRLNEQLLRRAEVIEQQESRLRQIESVAAERLSAINEKEAELGRLNEQLLRRAEVIEQQESRLRQLEPAASSGVPTMPVENP
jgi:hypothetical protein